MPPAQDEIKQLIEQITELQKIIHDKGQDGRAKLEIIGFDKCAPLYDATTSKFVVEAWPSLSEPEEQVKALHRLTQVRDSLRAAAELDGPPIPSHIMYSTHATNGYIVSWAVIGALYIIFFLSLVILQWDKATNTKPVIATEAYLRAQQELSNAQREVAAIKGGTIEAGKEEETKQLLAKAEMRQRSAEETRKTEALKALETGPGATESTVLLMVSLLGALGGSLHFLGSFVSYVGDRSLKRSWLLYYLSLPFVGAALAVIVYMLLRIGILTPTGQSNGGSAIANLNLIAIYAFAALSGLFAKTATEKLGDVFEEMFKPKPSRETGDKIGASQVAERIPVLVAKP